MSTANVFTVAVTANTGSQTTVLPANSEEILIVNDSATISAYLDLKGGTATTGSFEIKATEVVVLSNFRTKGISYITGSSTANLRILVLY